MLRINLPTADLFLDELNSLKNKRQARNIKEALNLRGYIITKRVDAKQAVSSYIFQTMCEIDGEMILFEYRSPETLPYPADAPSDEFKQMQTEYADYEKNVAKLGDLRAGYFDSL